MKKPVSVVLIVLASVLLLAVALSAYVNTLTLLKVNALETQYRNQFDDDDVAAEDGVVIAGEYKIESTKAISDAYISGDDSTLNEKEKETLTMASDVLSEIIKASMSAYEKEKAVYEWMISNLDTDSGMLVVIPETQDDCENPYGTLKYHNAVCVGYATTFRLFMQMLDIPCMVVHDSTRIHSWDLVKLSDGWYHTDIYSDISSACYSHFNRTDDMQRKTSYLWNTSYFPAADKYEFCYAYINAAEGKDVFDIPALIREAVDNGTETFSLKYNNLSDEKKVIADNLVSSSQMRLISTSKYENMSTDYFVSDVNDDTLVFVCLTKPDDASSKYISEDDQNKINEAIENAFGDLETGGSDDYDYSKYVYDGT